MCTLSALNKELVGGKKNLGREGVGEAEGSSGPSQASSCGREEEGVEREGDGNKGRETGVGRGSQR